jgi:hypothetical protein
MSENTLRGEWESIRPEKKASNVNSRSPKRSHCKQRIADAIMKESGGMTHYLLIYN